MGVAVRFGLATVCHAFVASSSVFAAESDSARGIRDSGMAFHSAARVIGRSCSLVGEETMDLNEIKESVSWLGGIIDERYVNSLMLEAQTCEGERRLKAEHKLQQLVGLRWRLELSGNRKFFRSPSERDAGDGEVTIGTVANAGRELYPLRVRQDFFYNHIVQVAAPSHGKSTTIASVKSELVKQNISWVSFDNKSDYGGLAKIHSDILVIDASQDLRFNIFEAPPGVEPKVWRGHVIDAFAHVGGWGHGVKGYMEKACETVVDERGDEFHIGHVFEVVNGWSETSRISQDYRDVLLSRLRLLNQSKDVFWCKKSMPFEKIKWLIIRTHNVAVEVHSLIFEILLLREFVYRLTNGIKDEQAELKVFFVDEASKTSLAEAREHDWTAREISTPTITKFLTMARQFKLGVWASDQLYGGLSDALKSVASTKIIGRLNSGEDIIDVSRDLSLEEDEKKAIRKLQVGEWIVRTARITKPFIIRTPDFHIPKITEEEIEAHMHDKRFWIEEEKKVEEVKQSVSTTLSQDEWYLLSHVNEHPFTQFSNRLRQGMGKGRLELAAHELIERGLVVERVVKLGAYRPWKLLELTDDGLKLLSSVGHDIRFWRHIKNEGIEHVMYKFLITDKLRQLGFEPVKEKRIETENGQRIVDVYYEENEKKVGIEVECSTSDIQNKLRALEKLDVVILATSTEESLRRMKTWLAQNGQGLKQNVRLVLLPILLKELQALIGRNASRRNSNGETKADSSPDGTEGGQK